MPDLIYYIFNVVNTLKTMYNNICYMCFIPIFCYNICNILCGYMEQSSHIFITNDISNQHSKMSPYLFERSKNNFLFTLIDLF